MDVFFWAFDHKTAEYLGTCESSSEFRQEVASANVCREGLADHLDEWRQRSGIEVNREVHTLSQVGSKEAASVLLGLLHFREKGEFRLCVSANNLNVSHDSNVFIWK